MSLAEDENETARRAQQIGFFHYMLIRDAADASLSGVGGERVRAVAAQGARPVRACSAVHPADVELLDRWRRGGAGAGAFGAPV
jgi:hypothetical protein